MILNAAANKGTFFRKRMPIDRVGLCILLTLTLSTLGRYHNTILGLKQFVMAIHLETLFIYPQF